MLNENCDIFCSTSVPVSSLKLLLTSCGEAFSFLLGKCTCSNVNGNFNELYFVLNIEFVGTNTFKWSTERERKIIHGLISFNIINRYVGII